MDKEIKYEPKKEIEPTPDNIRPMRCRLKEMVENEPMLLTQEDFDECLYSCNGFNIQCPYYVPKGL